MKKILMVLLSAALCFSMTACGGKAEGKQPATADVVKAVSAVLTFQDEMMTPEDKVIGNLYLIDEAKVAEKTVYVSATRSTASEVSVFKAKTAADVEAIKAAMNTRIEDQKLAYETYQPAEMVKINGAAIYTSGNYVMLVMADDTSKAEETFLAQF